MIQINLQCGLTIYSNCVTLNFLIIPKRAKLKRCKTPVEIILLELPGNFKLYGNLEWNNQVPRNNAALSILICVSLFRSFALIFSCYVLMNCCCRSFIEMNRSCRIRNKNLYNFLNNSCLLLVYFVEKRKFCECLDN